MLRKSKILSLLLCFSLLFEQSGFAQVAGALDISGHICAFRNSLIQDKFRPLHLRYLSYDNLNNNFKLLLDKGDAKGLKEANLEQSTRVLLSYFFVGISLPNDSFWVNLRPDQEGNMIDPDLARTDVGKILLEADLQLKKDTAKFTSPETPEGKEYWNKLYQKAGEIFGSENITIPTLTRPWIIPGEIIIREAKDNAYIYKATLKVCLEQDYLKDSSAYSFQDERLKELNEYSAQIIRERILPKLTKEVNTARRYAELRQVYYSLILAQWFKQRFLGKGGLYSWLIDKKNLDGLTSKSDWSKTAYFKEYQKSFKDGEYNVQESVYTFSGKTTRSYFSGGISLVGMKQVISAGVISGNPNELPTSLNVIGMEIKGGGVGNLAEIEVGKNQVAGVPQETGNESDSILLVTRGGITSNISVSEMEIAITDALRKQSNQLFNQGSERARVVDIGSTSRGTDIFEIGDKKFDIDFMVLFKNQGDLDYFRNNYMVNFADVKNIFEKKGLAIKHVGMNKNRIGDWKVNYFISNKDQEFKLEVNLSIEKKLYANWFNEQIKEIENLGADVELLKYDIKRMKKLVRQLGVYKIYEGGMGAVGLEQLVIQSGGSSEAGRQIKGVGSFHNALDWICRVGLDGKQNPVSLQKAKENFNVFDPETGEDFVDRLNEQTWKSLVALAKEYQKRRLSNSAERDMESGLGRGQYHAWSPGEVNNDNIDEYVERVRKFGSGQLAVHISNSELIKEILKKGYLLPRIYAESYGELGKLAKDLRYPTRYLHFAVDYAGNWKDNKVAFVASVEALLENKAYTNSPTESKRDWEVTGFSDSAYDISNRFYINELGVILAPSAWKDDAEFQQFISSLSYNPRIYYYEGETVQDGLEQFQKKYQIKPGRLPKISGYIENFSADTSSRLYMNIAPWAQSGNSSFVDLPQTAEEYAEVALRLYLLPHVSVPQEANQFAQKAYELDPFSAKSNLARALYRGRDGSIGEAIAYFEKAIELGLPRQYELLALSGKGGWVGLIHFYSLIRDFRKAVEARERLLEIADFPSGDARERYRLYTREMEESKEKLEAYLKEVNGVSSVADLAVIAQSFHLVNYDMDICAKEKSFHKFIDLAAQELNQLRKDSLSKVEQAKEKALQSTDKISDYYAADYYDDARSIVNLSKKKLESIEKSIYSVYEMFANMSKEGRFDKKNLAEYSSIEKLQGDVIRDIERFIKKGENDIGIEINKSEFRKESEDLNKAIKSGPKDANPGEVNEYFDKIDNLLKYAIKERIRRFEDSGGDSAQFKNQLAPLIREASATIDKALEAIKNKKITARVIDFWQGKKIFIPQNYKEQWSNLFSFSTAGNLGAQVSHIRNLDHLLRIINILRKSKNVSDISESASDREIIEFCINELKAQGLTEESADESGNRIIKIKKEAESNRLAQAIREWAIDKDGGVRAINFQGTDGIWAIVGFASELEDKDTLEHEQQEIVYRKQGYSWVEAHNLAGGQIIDKESARQYNTGRQDKIGAAAGRGALPKERALKQINEFNSAVRAGKYQQGAVVDLRGILADKEVILVGDLHARLDNLKKALNQNGNLKKIQKGEAVLVILGDAVHSETNLREMDSSIEIMQFIMDLKIDNPDNVYYLLGNHDYLSGNFSKGLVVQGLVYRNKMEELYGKEFVALYEDFIKASPLMVIGKGFVGVHGGPIKGVSLGQIQKVDVADEGDSIVKQAQWKRYKDAEFGYDDKDVQEFMKNMGQADGLLIVGHSPHLISSGRFFARLFDKHYVIFAGYKNAGYAVMQEGKINFVEITQASPILELEATNRQREEVAISSKLTKYLEINYSESGPIHIILAPNTGAEVKLAVFRYKDLPARFKEMGLNPDIEYFIVDEGPGKLSGGGFKEIRDGETVGIGRYNPGRFMLNPLISRDHISIKRMGDTFIVEDLNSKNGTEIRYTPFKQEVVPWGMGGTGFLPHIFNSIVSRLNNGQPLVLTLAEREVLLWGLLNPNRPEYTQIIAILNSLDNSELYQLKDMANRWGRPEDNAAGKLQDAINRVSERTKFGISDTKVIPSTTILISPKGKKMILTVRKIDSSVKAIIPQYHQMMNLMTLVLAPEVVLGEEEEKEITSLAKEYNVPLTIVQLEMAEKRGELDCVQFAFLIDAIERDKGVLGELEFFPFPLRDDVGIKGRIIYSDLLNVNEINELQQDALAAKAMLAHSVLKVLNPLSIGVLAVYYPQIIEFLIEIIQEYGRIGNPNVLESLRNLKEIVLKGKAESFPSEKDLIGVFEKNLERLNNELDSSIRLIEQRSKLSQSEGGMVTSDILEEWIKEGDIPKLVAHITRGLQGQNDNTRNEQIKSIIDNLEESKRGEFIQALKEKGIVIPALKLEEAQAEGPGGIDFRALPIVNQPVNTAILKLSAADLARLNNINIDSEWSQIQNMVNAGIIPSSQRIKEYMLACCLRKNSGSQISRVLGCIADILRIEEDRVLDTDVELKSILTLVESGRPESELQLGLSKIEILPQEPRFIAP
ncbi:MAG: metallophosphoesterase [Candidatus Omnitrophota bacterium]|jgi:UDP-2,3-diacylglucosamine pyrophosphatase LpxH